MRTLALLVAATLVVAPLPAHAGKPAPAPAAAQPAPQGRLLFAVHTGAEDLATLTSVMRQLKVAKESPHLAEVAVIFYGRSVSLFDPNNQGTADLRAKLAEARAAGVRVMVCGFAIERAGITVEEASTVGEVVPAAMGEIARLVAEGWEILSY